MIDIEGIFQALDEYLTGGQTLIGAAQELADNGEPLVEHQDKPMAEPFGPDDHRWVLAVTLGSHIIECWFVNEKKSTYVQIYIYKIYVDISRSRSGIGCDIWSV